MHELIKTAYIICWKNLIWDDVVFCLAFRLARPILDFWAVWKQSCQKLLHISGLTDQNPKIKIQ